jgi:hypothetical protein
MADEERLERLSTGHRPNSDSIPSWERQSPDWPSFEAERGWRRVEICMGLLEWKVLETANREIGVPRGEAITLR